MDAGTESSSDEEEDTLNIKSERFNPLKALYSKKLILPVSNIKIYDNISKYESVTKGLSSSSSSGSIAVRESLNENAELKDSQRRRFLPHQEPKPGGNGSRGRGKMTKEYTDKINDKNNVLTRMKSTLGPLEMILRCMDQRNRVKVYTRGARSIRGYILGYVVAFDKHWNLALEDCLEVWKRKVKRKVPALGIQNAVKKIEIEKGDEDEDGEEEPVDQPRILIKESYGKIESVERHVPQIMIRGEQIAIIVKID